MDTSTYPLISDQIRRPALEVVLNELRGTITREVPGAVCEFGCYIGTTSLFITRLLQDSRPFHVYDSFEGLPPKSRHDSSAAGVDFKAGELSVSKKRFLQEFQRAHLKPPVIHKRWFNQLEASDVPEEIAFAFLDGDFYDSIMDSLKLVWPRLSPGGVVCFDDYDRETLPGVARAVHDYFGKMPEGIRQHHNIGILRK